MVARANTVLVVLAGAAMLAGCAQGPIFGEESERAGPPGTYGERIQYDRATDDRAPPGIGADPGPGAH